MRAWSFWFAILLFPDLTVAQDKKPDDAKAATKPVEVTVAGKKATFELGAGWAEWKPDAAPDLPSNAAPWKPAGAWKSGNFEELTLRLFGVDKAGATATSVRDAWFAHAKSKGTPGIVVRADVAHAKEKAMSGHDIEVDFKSGDGKVYVWLRTLNLGKDRVAVWFAEARPLKPPEPNPFDQETFVREPHVLEIQPMLASFMKVAGKQDAVWARGPTFELSRGPASLKVDAPKGWEYTRLGPEGSIIWMAPGQEDQREFIVAFTPCRYADKLTVEKMVIETSGGKIFEDHDLSAGDGHEIISAHTLGDRTLWNWRRLYQRGEMSVSVLAKVPVADVSTQPSADVKKESKTFHESVRLAK